MIGVDWGTTSLRAFRLAEDGAILNRVESAGGILSVEGGRFAAALHAAVGPWLGSGEDRVLMSGMIGSRQGWREAPYLPCPADPADLAGAVVSVPFEGASVRIVPGLSDADEAGIPEVMRGEETQIAGVLDAIGTDGVVCLPGSHSKWAVVAEGRIAGFRTYLSGEAFSAIRAGTILGRMMADAPTDLAAFDRGVARSADPGHLLHHLFGVRALGLFGRLADTESASFLSGLLIGHEIAAALPAGASVHLIGAAPLCDLYARAVTACGGTPVLQDSDAAARGLAAIGRNATWT